VTVGIRKGANQRDLSLPEIPSAGITLQDCCCGTRLCEIVMVLTLAFNKPSNLIEMGQE